eukprot:5683700-Amphidinium_carterae.1
MCNSSSDVLVPSGSEPAAVVPGRTAQRHPLIADVRTFDVLECSHLTCLHSLPMSSQPQMPFQQIP